MANFTKLPLRQLGKNGPPLPRLGLGLMGASGTYGVAASDKERFALLDEAYKRGEIFWDTADKYGDSEDLLGKWFEANREKREDIFLATKFGMKSKPGGEPGLLIDSSPDYCHKSLEKSLKRLGQVYVDLYYVHRLDKITPIEKTIEAMAELKNAGKIRYLGLSECSAESLRRAHAVSPITCIQVEYSAFCLAIESPQTSLLEVARELGVAIVAYSPMGNGFLTGKLRIPGDFTKDGDLRAALPWLKEENLAKNLAVVDKITEIAKAKGENISTAQLALAWLLAQGDDIFAIPGTRRIEHMVENLDSMSIKVSAEEEKVVRVLSQAVVGGRMQARSGYDFADTPPL